MAIDYGGKRTGIAVTDEMQIIASGLTTVETKNIFPFLENYFKTDKVAKIIVGEPKRMNNEASSIGAEINQFVEKLANLYPQIEIIRMDERFTSKIAFQTMIDSGLKKKQRQNKALVDEIAATILLQDYMNSNR
ncbi:Holliday junction resolvase RuvX [Flavobacterium sp. CBA20B-1]|uniref:Holliday junction resolvase RuvX n=1 Tax=unclassified Flavobacterium TaxID=196869 RepID=UPI002224D740|nr:MULTISPECIES: Holliday junction resolvase RuvX [unclassified Flavobacterium]WCM42815.1 Holliday junction resolvase RuvX [Flavobacterium sp. CBA20B-1]